MNLNNEYKELEVDIIEYIKDFLWQILPMIKNDTRLLIKEIDKIVNSDDFKSKFNKND